MTPTEPDPPIVGDVTFVHCPFCKVDTFAGIVQIGEDFVELQCYNTLHEEWREPHNGNAKAG